MKKLFKKIIIYFLILSFGVFGSFAGSLNIAKAATLPTVPTVGFVNTSSTGSERISVQRFGVILSAKSTNDVTVDFKIVGGTAQAGINYKPYNGTVLIHAGELLRNVPLYVFDDLTGGPDKTVIIELSNPANANLGLNKTYTFTIENDNVFTTSLSTNPASPNGENNWFVTAPEVTLTPDRTVHTYYQWNSHNQGQWINYRGVITVPEGENTLYYFSKDVPDPFGVKEPLRAQNFKVDTLRPDAPSLSASVTAQGNVQLSWGKVGDAVRYEIMRAEVAGSNFSRIAVVGNDAVSFLDSAVTRGISYEYKINAIDEAGNKSFDNILTILVPKEAVGVNLTETVAGSTTVSMTENVLMKKIFKSIGTGISTAPNSQSIIPQVQGESQNIAEKKEEKTDNSGRNWNKLLLAISILIIAAGAAIGGYYGYEWWMARREEPLKEEKPKSKSRW